MATKSKYCVEQWVEYDKSVNKFTIRVADYDLDEISYSYKSKTAFLPKINGKW